MFEDFRFKFLDCKYLKHFLKINPFLAQIIGQLKNKSYEKSPKNTLDTIKKTNTYKWKIKQLFRVMINSVESRRKLSFLSWPIIWAQRHVNVY